MSERRFISSPLVWSLVGLIIFFLVIGSFLVKMFLEEDDLSTTKKIATVTLVKPLPPPVKKPQEPEPPKEKQPPREALDNKPGATPGESYTDAVSHKSDVTPAPMDHSPPPTSGAMESAHPPAAGPVNVSPSEASGEGGGGAPAGGPIGLDAVGTGGGDAFGLVARRGGRSITATGGGTGRGTGGPTGETGPVVAYKAPVSKPAPKAVRIGGNPMAKADGSGGGTEVPLLEKYGWYTEKVKGEVTAQIRKQLEENRQIPRGKFQTVIKISLDSLGSVIDTQIIGSSGNQEMDEMVKRSIVNFTITEPPPEGMPKTLVIRVTSQSG